jgi:hypothetical protein
MNETAPRFIDTLFSPPVLLTVLACIVLAAIVIWALSYVQNRRRSQALGEQRTLQESTIERLLDSVAQDKQKLVADYEARLLEQQDRITTLEQEISRLRDRLTSSGILGLFGGKQRDVVSALLLENEQLHELLAQKQGQLRDLMGDMTDKLLERMDEQAKESAQAVRYKQALLSAFLQQEEVRRMFDQMIVQGKVSEGKDKELPADGSQSGGSSLRPAP